ncbi:hypothetical protein MJO29_015528 [Puccinia striiformis f. sp. tritici]|nr:hypothetical protein MJO29_015528 [Puccinia striiformis f. sp. tritici]
MRALKTPGTEKPSLAKVHNGQESGGLAPKYGTLRRNHKFLGASDNVQNLDETQRFILTNTGSLTTQQLYKALSNTLKEHPNTLKGILKVKQVFQPNRRTRFDLWVKNQNSAGLQKALGLDYLGRKKLAEKIQDENAPWHTRLVQGMLPRYRLSKWKAFRDRVITKTRSPKIKARDLNKFLTWNINGIHSKLPCLKDLLSKNNVAIAAVQEHLRTVCQPIPMISGYNVFERPKEEGFRGHCLYVHNTLAAHEVQTDTKHIIHVKTFGLTQDQAWHILAVYMPSGNARVKDRNNVWKDLSNLYDKLKQSSPNALVTILGDLNQNLTEVQNALENTDWKLHDLVLRKDDESTSTRNTPGRTERYIDHVITSKAVDTLIEKVVVDKLSYDVSDHWPVFTYNNVSTSPKICTSKSWDRKAINGHGIELALSNRWDILNTEHIETEDQLNECADKWVETLDTIGTELGMLDIPRERKNISFDRSTVRLINISRKTRQKLNEASKADISSHIKRKLIRKLELASKKAKIAIKRYAAKLRQEKGRRINSMLLDNEGEDFHRAIQALQGRSKTKQDNTPCFNLKDELVTNPDDILEARATYSEILASDPTGISKDKKRWEGVTPPPGIKFEKLHITRLPTTNLDDEEGGIPEDLANLIDPLDADAFITAIRQMQRRSAPGKSGVLAMHLKKFLEVECQLQLGSEWEGCPQNEFGDNSYPQPLDYSTVALDRWSLPSKLLTPPLRHLLNIMRACIKLKTQPKNWNEEVLITLPKPGQDPRYLKNTRGITLSCTEGKLLLTIVAIYISQLLEKRNFFSPAQAGFRNGQEAISHVIALTEIIRRRRAAGLSTYVLYIDFQKAFDRVPHEGLWARLAEIGIHPDLIEIIKKGYDNSSIQCRLGGKLSRPFTRAIGTRQGCPLSPLLFIIFVNDILNEITRGVRVPGLPNPAQGLLFADDTLVFADNPQDITKILGRLSIYCTKWHFALGHGKCGVVEYHPEGVNCSNPPIEYPIDGGVIKTADTYKYLGCLIPNMLAEKEAYPIELEHSKLLAVKANKAKFMTLPLFNDKSIHLLCKARAIQTYVMASGAYGAEWIGMQIKRTTLIERVIDQSMRISYGHKAHNKSLSGLLMHLEMGVTPLSIHSTKQRIRMWYKGPDLKTILKDLIKFPHRTKQGSSWVGNTQSNISKYKNAMENEQEESPSDIHTVSWIQDMQSLKLFLHPHALTPIGSAEHVSEKQKTQQKWLNKLHVRLLKKEFLREMKRNNHIKRYDKYSFGKTSNFVATSLNMHSLVRGVVSLSLLRIDALPKTGARIQGLNAQGIPHQLEKGICPCCNCPYERNDEEWFHIILFCPHFSVLRRKKLSYTINVLTKYLQHTSEIQFHIYILLLGGLDRVVYPDSYTRCGDESTKFQEVDYGGPELTNWVNGYGHIPHLYPKEFSTHGYVPLASFLQEAVPMFEKALYKEGLTQSNTSLVVGPQEQFDASNQLSPDNLTGCINKEGEAGRYANKTSRDPLGG